MKKSFCRLIFFFFIVSFFGVYAFQQEASNGWYDLEEDENYTARHENSFVQAGTKFYLMGGRENATTIDIYNYTTNTWEALKEHVPKSFNHFQATEYGGIIWIIGAFKNNKFPNEVPEEHVWGFDPLAKQWIKGPMIPTDRRRGAGGLVVFEDKFYTVAGNTREHNGGFVPWFDVYDPATGKWKTLADAPRARDHFFATVIDRKLYLAGGRLSGGADGTFIPTIAEVDVYDFDRAQWETLPKDQNLPTPRAGAPAVNYKDKLMVIGGEVKEQEVYGKMHTDALEITEVYDPKNRKWTRWQDLNHKRYGTQAIVSGNGVFVLGGSTKLGGGRQHNLEAFGAKTPEGKHLRASKIRVPKNIKLYGQKKTSIPIQLKQGNVGKFIVKVQVSAVNTTDFQVEFTDDNPIFIKPKSSCDLNIEFLGDSISGEPTVTLFFNGNVEKTIRLK